MSLPGEGEFCMAYVNVASPPGRIGSLDTLRGVAIIAVLCSHLLGTLKFGDAADEALIGFGRGGVTLFFLLSGYLIFRNVQVQSFSTFLSRRFFKLMPAYWLNIIVILLADLTIGTFTHFPAKSYVAGLLAVTDVLGIQAVSGVFWTLLIEIKFYIFIAIQYALLGRRHLRSIFAALVTFAVLVAAVRGRGSQLLAYFPVFYLGIEIRLAEEERWSRPALLRLGAVMTALAASLLFCLDQLQLASSAYLVASTFLFVIALRYDISNRLIGFLGKTSYSNYLFHSLAAGSVFSIFGMHQGLAAISEIVGAFLAASAVAVVLYHAVEVPMVDLGRCLEVRPALRTHASVG